MKRFLMGIFAAQISVAAFGTTLNPIQLLNPAGSTSGQAIVSTGASSVPSWANVSATALAAQAANTVVANVTGSSASPTAFAMPSCTGSTNALGYTSGTGIVCNGSINAATLNGATFAAPPAAGYGSGTPEPVAATTISATGLISPTSTVGIKGTTTNDSPAAGSIGENPSSGSSITLSGMTTATAVNFGSFSATAGDWLFFTACVFQAANTTVVSSEECSVSTTSGVIQSTLTGQTALQNLTYPTTGSTNAFMAPVVHLKFTTSTTVFLVGVANFGTSTLTGGGFIYGIRIR